MSHKYTSEHNAILDRRHIWHPFTQQSPNAPHNINITRGEGSILYSEDGKGYVDLVSSWWCNIHGHGNEKIAAAIASQATRLEHVIFGGHTHNPAIDIARKILMHMPPHLNKIFFSDNGSTAVEVALKVAYQYWHNTEGSEHRNTYISFAGGYHGDTLGAMSVGASSGYYDPFRPILFNCSFFNYPAFNELTDDNRVTALEDRTLQSINEYLKKNSSKTIALIVEPLIQGASGMNMARPNFFNDLIQLCHNHDIPVIFDEIMTGFYRTGTMFAMDQMINKPDILCLSKGLTGGFLPLSMTIISEKIYAAFYGTDPDRTFLHGHTYTANPIACAAANASYDLLMKQETQSAIKSISEFMTTTFKTIDKLQCAKNARATGCIGAFDISEKYIPDMHKIIANLRNAGLLMRPLVGKTLYWMPPYCTTTEELEKCFGVMLDVIGALCAA